jgi:hypothetical protein
MNKKLISNNSWSTYFDKTQNSLKELYLIHIYIYKKKQNFLDIYKVES